MGFKANEIADNIRQKIKNLLSENDSHDTAEQAALSNSESEDLNQGLSGEHISAGFSDAEAKQLKENFSGQKDLSADLIEHAKTDETEKKQNLALHGEMFEGFLNLTPDSIKYYSDKYPNASKVYFKNGVITFLDNDNCAVLNANGEPLRIDYNTENFDLVSFYLNHAKDDLDINKLLELKELQDRINSTPVTDKNYKALICEIKVQKLELMNDKERKNYITTQIWNAFTSKDATAWLNTLSEFYDYKCRVIDQKFGISGTKEFIKEKTHLNDLIAYINNILEGKADKLTKTELIWEIIKGIGDAIDSFARTHGLTMTGVTDGATKAVSSIPKIGPVLTGAIQAYFGTEGEALINGENIDGANSKANNTIEHFNADKIMTKNELASFKTGFIGLSAKEFRAKISKSNTIEELNVIRKIIEESSYTKAEKQMLQNECAKQQGAITNNPNTAKLSLTEKFNEKKIHSALSNEAKKHCKTPEQKEMAKLWLSERKLFMAIEDMESKKLYLTRLLENCTTEDLNVRKLLIGKISENPKFIDKNGTLIKEATDIIQNIKQDELDTVIKLLEEYKNSDSELGGEMFLRILNGINLAEQDSAKLMAIIKAIINSKKPDFAQIEKDNNLRYLTSLSDDGMTISGIPTEDILANPNLKDIALLHIYGLNSKEIANLQKTLIKNISAKQTNKPIMLKSAEGKNIFYTDYIKAIIDALCRVTDNGSNISLVDFASKILTDKALMMDSNALSILLKIVQSDCLHPYTSINNNFEIYSYILKKPEFSQDNIILIMKNTTAKNLNLNKKIIDKKSLTAQEKIDIISAIYSDNSELITLVELVLDKGYMNAETLCKLIQATKIYDAHNAGRNNEKIDPEKIDRYLRLLQNPKTVEWTVKMINEGKDIETISRLAAAKQNFYIDDNGETVVTDRNSIFFMNFGLNQKEAESVVKAISQNGILNTEMQQTAIDLINKGIPKNKVGQILNDATIMGDYNPKIPADAMALHGMKLNGFVERYLPILNHMEAKDITTTFNEKTKNQLKTKIENIPERTKPALRAKGFDIEGILKKLDS